MCVCVLTEDVNLTQQALHSAYINLKYEIYSLLFNMAYSTLGFDSNIYFKAQTILDK